MIEKQPSKHWVTFVLVTLLGITACSKAKIEEPANLSETGSQSSSLFKLALGTNHTCVSNGSTVSCFGKNDVGQLGRGKKNATLVAEDQVPGKTVGIEATGGQVIGLVAGADHTCVLQGGRVKCWGSEAYGKTGLSGDRTVPAAGDDFVPPADDKGKFSAPSRIFAGTHSTCTIFGKEDQVQCLGNNLHNLTPTTYPNSPAVTKAVMIALGCTTTCLVKDGGLRCAGQNDKGQLGNETIASNASLSGVATLERSAQVTAVSMGQTHTCAIAYGKLFCWGDNSSGQLGLGTTTTEPNTIPKEVSLPGTVTSISMGNQYSCAIASSRVYCWGLNDKGQLGDGSNTNRPSPTLVAAVPRADLVQTAASPMPPLIGSLPVPGEGQHTCAVDGSSLYCWGSNVSGQLGNGNTIDLNRPTKVQVSF